MSTVLILGAKSDIASALVYKFAKENFDIQLAARNSKDLVYLKKEIELRFSTKVFLYELDILKYENHQKFISSLKNLPEIVISAVGLLGDQSLLANNIKEIPNILRSNFEGPAIIFSYLAIAFQKRGSGTLVGISSVAGERGRSKNLFYGSSKAGFTSFLSGLRGKIQSNNVNVITVLPGFVNTKMTEYMKLPKLITSSPDEVANRIYKGIKDRNEIIYVGRVWFIIMMVIKLIPEKIFKKLNI